MKTIAQNYNLIFKIILSALMAIFIWINIPLQASAQLQIQIGGNEADFKARLAADGYDRITTKKLGLSESKFDAC